jgi:hypothetical protein
MHMLGRLPLKVHQRRIHDADAFILHEARSDRDMMCDQKLGKMQR